MYDFEIEKVGGVIKKRGYETVGLQFPEGLMEQAPRIADEISAKTSCFPLICAGPCYGACDLADREMKDAGADALFHFGHSEIPMKTYIPVHYVECRSDADPIALLSKNIEGLPSKVGLVASIQHVHTLDAVRDYLSERGFQARIGKAKGRAKYPGQVLGCSFSAAKSLGDSVDAFLYIGSGNFHPLGVALSTGKRTLAVDVLTGVVRDVSGIKDKILKQRYGKLAKAMNAESYGIVVGGKKGQMRKRLVAGIMKKLKARGKRAYLLHLDEVTPENIMPFRHLDALVNTACPRIAIEDASRYKQPMLTPIELDMVLGQRGWDAYEMDEF